MEHRISFKIKMMKIGPAVPAIRATRTVKIKPVGKYIDFLLKLAFQHSVALIMNYT
jgi:hypothetical protein